MQRVKITIDDSVRGKARESSDAQRGRQTRGDTLPLDEAITVFVGGYPITRHHHNRTRKREGIVMGLMTVKAYRAFPVLHDVFRLRQDNSERFDEDETESAYLSVNYQCTSNPNEAVDRHCTLQLQDVRPSTRP